MRGLEIRELECFLVLSEELHFGRTGERLYISQSRVSQLLRALERRVGTRLVARTSRHVRLTAAGEEFLASLRPAYDALVSAVEQARAAAHGTARRIRIGFQGAIYEEITRAITAFQARHPECRVDIAEIPLSDPFGALRRETVDAAVVLLPVEEPDLHLGPVFSEQQQRLAVSVRHPFAQRARLDAEDLARVCLIPLTGPAPEYWKRVHSPQVTPKGRPIPQEGGVQTLQEGLTLIAAGRGAMLLCGSTAEYNRRRDIAFVPVGGLPMSALGLIWPRSGESAHLKAFAAEISDSIS
ncbi:LysR family transcriptional regulator [Marinactinospora thermotolerans]|uniref:Transcriptional regulator, LysR family n=1 Tax=Marinactinospora thermotolerans DSM 45154 TaxID=1122192 RepID=A0A1T4R2X3_9ACTN|nr:LysR family transcriptional regulator [Marinactinospora thermotolerans]SKA10313.1 transcriptional regulator, LysR family [Marinactinospora thermotolerans DSM 45154]